MTTGDLNDRMIQLKKLFYRLECDATVTALRTKLREHRAFCQGQADAYRHAAKIIREHL